MGRMAEYVPMTTPTAPYDEDTNRLLDSRGGPAFGGQGLTIGHGLVDGLTREGCNPNEAQVQHERTPSYHQTYLGSSHDWLVNWTDSGPVRPGLWMRQQTIRRLAGTDATRNFDPHPIGTFGTQDQGHGMHTNPPQPKTGVNKNFRGRTQQQPARINRLSPAVYTGQSYSQTTQIQGG